VIFADALALISAGSALFALLLSATMYFQVLGSKSGLKPKLNYRNLVAIHELLFPESGLRKTRRVAEYGMVFSILGFAILESLIAHKHNLTFTLHRN
jgi:hypothetical protein